MKDFKHDTDCPCFGDSVEHSEDCRNCECEKNVERRVKAVCEKLSGPELLRKLLWRVPILLLDHDAHAEILRRLK